MKKNDFILFCLGIIGLSSTTFPMAHDNELRPFAEANLRQISQMPVNKTIHVLVHLDHRNAKQALVIEGKDE